MADFLKEKIFYHSLNIACDNNFNFLATLKKYYTSFEKAWNSESYFEVQNQSDNKDESWQKLIINKKSINPQVEWEKILNSGIDLILLEEINYQPSLKEIHKPPSGIYIKGSLKNETPKIAIVGTRKSTEYGKRVAEKLSRELSGLGITIVSGLAEGIDTFSHKSAIDAGGQTIAVLGTGFNHIFPASNIKLAEKIVDNGCLISEYCPETMGARHQFPARNRIISGLSLGTIVIEAPEKSGSLITAKIALEQNREVFAVPGSIFSRSSIGPNELIKQGAKLVSCVEDILTELNISVPERNNLPENNNLAQEEKIILNIIRESETPKVADEIIIESGLSPELAGKLLTMLELKSLIENSNGKYWTKN